MPSPFHLGRCRGLHAAVLLAAASLAQAQGTPGRADPLEPQAGVPAAAYTSPLAGYRRLGDDTRVPWPQANQTVNRIGGWRAYAREAQQPAPAASAPAGRSADAPAPAPAAAPAHRGHRTP